MQEQDNSGNEVAPHNITQFNEAYSISFCGFYFCFFGVKTDSIIREIIDVIQALCGLCQHIMNLAIT